MSASQQVINALLAPVILITATAILLSSIYARMGMCIERIRNFDERIEDMTEHAFSNLI